MLAYRQPEIAYAGGLFDGEGCISRDGGTLTLSMTDRDSVERFAAAVGVGEVHLDQRARSGKQMYRWRVHRFEHRQAVTAMLWPWLNQRRRVRALDMLAEYPGALRDYGICLERTGKRKRELSPDELRAFRARRERELRPLRRFRHEGHDGNCYPDG